MTPARGPTRRRGWATLGALIVVVLAGCSARATLTVTVRGDGSGTLAAHVVLDPEAVRAAEGDGTPLATRVRLTDLSHAGWSVPPWTTNKDGSASITLTRAFRTPDAVAALTRQLNGSTGPLPALAASRDPAWLGAAHTVTVHGRMNLRAAEPGVTGDTDLVQRLTGQHVDLAGIETELAGQLHTGVSLRVVVAVPGHREVVISRSGVPTPIAASGTSLDVPRIAFAATALALIVAAAFVWRRGSRRRSRPRRRAPTG